MAGRQLLSVSFKRRPPLGSLSEGWTELNRIECQSVAGSDAMA